MLCEKSLQTITQDTVLYRNSLKQKDARQKPRRHLEYCTQQPREIDDPLQIDLGLLKRKNNLKHFQTVDAIQLTIEGIKALKATIALKKDDLDIYHKYDFSSLKNKSLGRLAVITRHAINEMFGRDELP